MNILFICDEYPPCMHGGIGTVTRLLASELVKKGNNVVVCGFYPYYRTALDFEDDSGVKVYRKFYGSKIKLMLSKRKFFGSVINIKQEFLHYIKFLTSLINEHKIELIEMPDYFEVFRYSGPKFIEFPDFGIPKIVKVHGSDSFFSFIRENSVEQNLQFQKELKVINDASVVLAISEYSKSVVKKVFDYKKKIHVIYNGIENESDITYLPETLSKDVVFAGTITEKKGVYNLVLAWRKVVSEIPDARLILFGKGSEKSLLRLNSLISDSVKPTIQIIGFAERNLILTYYSSAACAIFPSYAESFGMAPIEAMQIGCPTIFTKRASGPELIRHEIEGLLIDPDNIDEIAEAILYLLENRKKAVELGAKGALKVNTHFSISRIADQHIKLYSQVIKNMF